MLRICQVTGGDQQRHRVEVNRGYLIRAWSECHRTAAGIVVLANIAK